MEGFGFSYFLGCFSVNHSQFPVISIYWFTRLLTIKQGVKPLKDLQSTFASLNTR